MTAKLSTIEASALSTWSCVVLGVGGLGHPLIAELMAQGVRRWTLIDPDRVEASNLHRQWLFAAADRGRLKVDVAAQWIKRRDPKARIERIAQTLDPQQAPPFAAKPLQIFFECSDSPRLKFALSRWALERGAPAVIGGVLGWQGQVFSQFPQAGCYRCLFEAPPQRLESCESAGVFTPAAAFVGRWMVARGLQLAQEIQEATSDKPFTAQPNRLSHIDLRNSRMQSLQAPARRDCCHDCALARPREMR